jgi:hypothetical protein
MARFLIHDRDTIFSSELDAEVKSSFGLRVLRTPVRAPRANAYCERLIGTARRECLDFMIPLHERHLRGTLRSWVAHYNKGRPHSSLGPGTPEPTPGLCGCCRGQDNRKFRGRIGDRRNGCYGEKNYWTLLPSPSGGDRAGIKRLGWSPCVLFSCLLPVRDDALPCRPLCRPVAALYRPLFVSLPCRQFPTG